MITILYPSPAAIVFQQAKEETVQVPLALADPRLKAEVPAEEVFPANFTHLLRLVNRAAKVPIGTQWDDMNTSKGLFLFDNVRAGDLMEAYGLLYTMRWIRYKNGRPAYELAQEKDVMEIAYGPQDEYQERRFKAMNDFMRGFDQMSPEAKSAVLSGKRLRFSDLPREMADAAVKALEALNDGNAAAFPNQKKRDIGPQVITEISIKDHSEPGAVVRDYWVSINTKLGGPSFRWNDYDKEKMKGRPVASNHAPLSDKAFSKKKMIATYKKLGTAITIPENTWKLADLLKHLHANYGINFMTHEDTAKLSLPFSCDNLPLWEVMDKISEQYGHWQWEAGAGDFIVMRANGSPRQRIITQQ